MSLSGGQGVTGEAKRYRGSKLSEHIDPESATVESENDETFTIAYSPHQGIARRTCAEK